MPSVKDKLEQLKNGSVPEKAPPAAGPLQAGGKVSAAQAAPPQPVSAAPAPPAKLAGGVKDDNATAPPQSSKPQSTAPANTSASKPEPIAPPSSPKPSVPVSTIPGSLCRISLATLLFLAFEGRYSVPLGLHLVYNRKDLLSSGHFIPKTEPDKPSDLSGS